MNAFSQLLTPVAANISPGDVPVATTMRRLLAGHGTTYNRRYRLSVHLFKNRYKSFFYMNL
jgi:hypothetical protein